MNLRDRLAALEGHEIFVTTSVGSDDADVPGGVLEEVGDDYALVKTEDEENGGFATSGAQWFVNLAEIIHVVHIADCKRCAVDDVSRHRPR